MTMSSAAVAASLAQETGEAWITLLSIAHPDLATMPEIGGTIRFAHHPVDIVSRGATYRAAYFEVSLPDDAEEVPRVTLRVENVDRLIADALRAIASAPTVTLEVVLGSTPDVIEAGPYELTLRRVDVDAVFVEGELVYDDMLNEPYPGDSFTPDKYPGLFP